jgi:cytochrome c-type biogenesis protein
MDIGLVGYLGAFAAGVLSFVSPCVFPLIPAYLAQMTGMSFDELTGSQDQEQRRRLLVNSLAFVLGLAIVSVLLGASATLLGRFLVRNQNLVERIAGLVIIIFGLHMMSVIRIPGLTREARVDIADARKRAAGPVGSGLMGAAFGVGWTPCIGPVLASILAVAGQASTVGIGMALLLAYALGLGVPFILMALLMNRAIGRRTLGRVRQYLPQLSMASGALLITMGLLVFTGNLIQLSNWITATFGTGLTI